MANYSQAHICQCLSRIATVKRNSVVTITGNRHNTGQQFVQDVLNLARGLLEIGLRSGDIVAISALNRSTFCIQLRFVYEMVETSDFLCLN